MPAGKKQQNSTMITLVIFVALFFVAAILAVVFYLNAENYRTRGTDLQRQVDDLASRSEVQGLSTLVGAKESGRSWLGAMVDYHNRLLLLLLGTPVDSTSAELKSVTAQTRAAETIQLAKTHIEGETIDPNTGLVPMAKKLMAVIDNIKTSNQGLKKQVDKLQNDLDDMVKAGQEKEKELSKQMVDLKKSAEDANKQCELYQKLVNDTSDERAKTLESRWKQEGNRADQLNQDLLKTRAELDQTHQRLKIAMDKLYKIEPAPDRGAVVYKPDGKVTVVDEQARVVYLNLGSKDRIYQGLTFAVYDGAGAIPKDGKGKAEVEVFRIMPDTCVARVVSLDPRHPIVMDDIVANLIWDKDKVYKFALVGDFDVNRDGRVDQDGTEAVVRLMEKWGAQSTDEISAQLDAVIIGLPPQVPAKPTANDIEADPTADQKYNTAQKRLDHYKAIQEQAKDLMIPILPYDTFLYLVGYRGQSQKPGAF